MAASRRTVEFLKRSDFIMICLLLLLKNARRIKLGVWLSVLSLSRFEQRIVVAELRFGRSFNYDFEIYVCRQVLFIDCGWFFNLHKQSACLGRASRKLVGWLCKGRLHLAAGHACSSESMVAKSPILGGDKAMATELASSALVLSCSLLSVARSLCRTARSEERRV